jgi:hypothetical protein
MSMVFFMVCALAAGIFLTCRGQGIRSNDSLREALIWGSGFIIYAAFDYFILMR